jgi:hypothetical protein
LRPNGSISHCLDEYVDGVPVSDELRKLLIVEDSDHYEVPAVLPESASLAIMILVRAYSFSTANVFICPQQTYSNPFISIAVDFVPPDEKSSSVPLP